jgi:chaperonin GroES
MMPQSQPLPSEMGAMAPQQQEQLPQPAVDPMEQEPPKDHYVDYALSQANLAKAIKRKKDGQELLDRMGSEISRGYDEDEQSRQDWLRMNEMWIKMAMLVKENKTYPWPKASNIKYPLLATAAMQFTARAYPALVPSDGSLVKTRLLQKNPQDTHYEAASRISTHMSYQLLEKIPNWEEDMDKLLMCMSISGVCFKKTYHSKINECHHSEIVYPENLCVNYHAKSIEKAYRKTEILRYTDNEVEERVNNNEEFLDVDLSAPVIEDQVKQPLIAQTKAPQVDSATPHVFLACHTYWDLDDDGYEEPYIITIHKKSKKVVRIIARWDMDGVKTNDKGKIIKIKPVEYFTDFPFIPNPDGSIYGIGFGILLGPLNESANTIINQLVDSGTLNNLQAGFIGKGLRIKMGATGFQPGEWKAVNATGDDLSKNIFPLPTKEPSAVLMSLLQMLITSGNQLASIAEIFVGKMPGQNTPATTTQEAVQQGMAVFTAIYKRVYRSLDKEFKKLYRLNKINPDIVQEESKVTGLKLQSSDYELPDWIIIPGADPVGDSSSVKMAKLEQVGKLLSLGTINPQVFTKRVLDANEIPNPKELIAPPAPPPPDPKAELIKAQTQAVQQKAQIEGQTKQQDMAMKEKLALLDQTKKELELRHEQQMQALKQQGEQQDQKFDMIMKTIENHFKIQTGKLDLGAAAAKHEQAMQHKEEAHKVAQKTKAKVKK